MRPTSLIHGFSLPELVIAMALGLLIINAALHAYSDIRTSAKAAEHRAELEERLSFALALIEADIQLAGFWGLHSNPDELTIEPSASVSCGGRDISSLVLQPARSIVAESSLSLPCPTPGRQVAGSDALTVRHASPRSTQARTGRVQLQAAYSGGRIFADGSVEDDGIRRVHDLQVHSWYIDTHSSERPLPSLRRLTLVHGQRMQNDEIMPGIEDLQIMLGIDTNNDGGIDSRVHPHEIAGPKALAVTIELTARLPSATQLPPITVSRTIALRNAPAA